MKKLILVRHAKSSWDDPSLSDRERPLNKRGKRNAPVMGERLAASGHRPGLVISSPANRARTTAGIVAGALGIEADDLVIDDDLYFTGAAGMLGVLERVDDGFDSVMMVGHNPTMTHLVNSLSRAGLYNMPTCAIAVIGFDMESWGLVQSTDGELLAYGIPKGDSSQGV